MKACIKCGDTKPLNQFRDRKLKSGKSVKNNKCIECLKAYSRQHYKHNPKMYGGKTSQRRTIAQHQMLNYLSNKSCFDCHNTDFRVLEFDHISNKKMNVSSMVAGGYAWSTILSEIQKCEIVCANCHRIRTFRRSNSYKIQL